MPACLPACRPACLPACLPFTLKIEVLEDDEKTLIEQNRGLGELLKLLVLQNRVESDRKSTD
jgi:hypothetical protein